ncbi:sensor histidine kinase [Streptomyces sp. WI04-05B]|uniref:sensor histidine kinase n=1 Tax=Streptomyces TaxID=1883 RepID=UPI0029B7A587|nr:MULTISPECIES: ATP-binding protein [unclassified Streptomyces]MDX2546000.1 ATP-binding protein [Streptomyces sp. WI04-05B]MDX2582699.1 ATP-binding protein [Streptomyces sp. WI04-05A]MDX3746986.1 ATP-binding protein [Streptomyces sp. AK08-02]
MIRRCRETYRRLRLGTRLALGMGVLALVVFAAVGTSLSMYMREYLVRQLSDQMSHVQTSQAKDVAVYGGVKDKPYWGWYSALYNISGPGPVLRKPADLPPDASELLDTAEIVRATGAEPVLRTARIDGASYRLRACEVENGVVLVTAAPLGDMEDTMDRLVTVQVVAFALALLGLVIFGRAVLRRGLRPLSDMAHTARGITSHDFTDSARLPVRADRADGGPEVEELRTAFNTMLEHIDDSLAVRTEAEQRLRRFVADASHELRTPLMSVRGYADLFQYAAANEPGERDRHLARLRAEAARMGVLLDDLLLLARLDAAQVETPLRPESADLVELAGQAADAFRAGHPDHPLTVTAPPKELRLRLDPLRIRQVLDNLLTNAAVHTPAGTAVSLEVSVDDGHAVVRVADAGPGIPAADRDRIFDRFYRVDKARSRDRGGSGLGLAVALSLVRAHDGTLDVTGGPGETAFTLRIPLDRTDRPDGTDRPPSS